MPNYVFAAGDILVTVGQDGLVANTAKYALERPIIAVNPDPQRIDGILLPFHSGDAAEALHQLLRGHTRIQLVTLAEASLNDGQRLLAFNELFIGAKSHVSARYQIELGGRAELHSSSGVLVSTGAGSTGWVSSVFNMVAGVNSFSGAKGNGKAVAATAAPVRRPWDDPNLIFVVREPFVSKVSQAGIVAGLVRPTEPLTISSNMPQHGVIFSDGVEDDFLTFNTGAIASIGAAKERALFVVK